MDRKLVIYRKNIKLFIMFSGILLTPYYLRALAVPRYASYNILFWIPFVYMVFSRNIFLKLKPVQQISILVYAALFMVSVFNSESIALSYGIRALCAIVMPAILIYKEPTKRGFLSLFRIWRMIINVMVIAVVIGGLIDLFTSRSVSVFFSNLYAPIASSVTRQYMTRMISFWGHPLTCSAFILAYYITNFIYYSYIENTAFRKGKVMPMIAISLIGMGLTGSKTGLVVLLVMTILLFVSTRRYKTFAMALVVFYAIYISGIFDLVIQRFLEGVAIGDVSTGRFTTLSNLWGTSALKFSLFRGTMIDNSDWRLVAALEFPIIGWAYKYGIVFSVLACIMTAIVPLNSIIKVKNFQMLICFLGFLAFMHTNNGMTIAADDMLVYCIVLFFIQNAAKLQKGVLKAT